MSNDLTPHGQIIERARGAMSKRRAARLAGISEGRWRQVVTGRQPVGGGQTMPANPRRETLIAMASAVGADVDTVLRAAGREPLGVAELHDGEVAVVAEDEDMAAIQEAVREAQPFGPATVQDIRDRLDAVIHEAQWAQRLLDRLAL